MSRQDVEVECDIVRETDNAILLRVDDEEIWIPLSQVKRIQRGNSLDTITMTAWIAEQKGIDV